MHITYNDNAIVNVLKIFRDVMKNRAPYDGDLVDSGMRQQTAKAFDKGIDCILATQIVVDGAPKRSLDEIGYERRNGYSWYNTEPQELYARYETWVKKNKITNRVMFK